MKINFYLDLNFTVGDEENMSNFLNLPVHDGLCQTNFRSEFCAQFFRIMKVQNFDKIIDGLPLSISIDIVVPIRIFLHR